MSDERVIAAINHCEYIGVEKEVESNLLAKFSCVMYIDRAKNRRLLYIEDGKPVAGVIFDKWGTVLQMYTEKESRRKGVMRQLFGVAYMYGIRCKFDANLTDEGEAFVKNHCKDAKKPV